MAARPSSEITLTKLRDGAPDALAALCRLRGAAILAYSTQMAGRDHAVEAAAATFARFRLAATTPGALTDGRQAEPLLCGAARRSVLAHVLEAAAADEGDVLSGECRTRADQLLGYLENSLPAGERGTVGDHVTRCRVCATTLRRLQEGEAAFRAVDRPLPGWVGKQILTAMVGAAPLGDDQADAIAVRDEALALLSGQGEMTPAAAEPQIEPAREIEPEPGPGAADEPEPQRPAVSFARAESAEPAASDPALGSRPDRTLARRLLRLLAVVAVSAAVGALLGIGLAKLSGDDAPAPALSTAPTAPTPATPPPG